MRRLVESFGREHLRCIHGRRQQADEIANRSGRGLVALDGTGQGILGPRALGLGMAPEREQAHEARRHGEREDGQERRERRPAPAPSTGVFELRDRTRLDREPVEPALQVVRERSAEAYRRRGSFRRQVRAIVSRSRGRPGTSVLGGAGSRVRTRSSVSITDAAWNGGRPVKRL